MNEAVVLPLPTVTVAGTVATEVGRLDSDTTAPPLGAGPLSVTVPVESLPPTTEDGLKVRATSAADVTVMYPTFVLVSDPPGPATVSETL
jgi:hypothetical protein